VNTDGWDAESEHGWMDAVKQATAETDKYFVGFIHSIQANLSSGLKNRLNLSKFGGGWFFKYWYGLCKNLHCLSEFDEKIGISQI
jgi:hypothetical protein